MTKLTYLTVLLFVWSATPAQTQDAGHQHHASHDSPYADQKPSGIAGLSLSELEELRSGAGMGLARPAELNRYPGPKHVLELAAELKLSDEQRAEVEEIRQKMLDEAKRVGAQVIDREEILGRRFAHRHIDAETLRESTAEIGLLRGELRFVHLVAHLETAAILTTEQIDAYHALRGYGESES